MNILINGISSKVGGGKSILLNLLNEINSNYTNNNIYYCIVNDKFISNHTYNNIIFLKKRKNINVLFYYIFYINILIKKNNIKLLLNLGDIPVISSCRQIFLFDWAFAVYPNDPKIWTRMNFKDYCTRKFKILLFTLLKYNIDEFFVQTNLIGKKLTEIYSIDNSKITLFPNAISFDHFSNNKLDNFNFKNIFTNKKIFLCLSAFYSHKNIEILIAVAKLLKEKKSNFVIILTLPVNGVTNKILNKIYELDISDNIKNIGEINSIDIPNLYNNVDALLLPTLLESFSGTYIEAMFAKIPIFTSDYDFAHEVCKDSAIYFDPLNAFDIYSKLLLINNLTITSKKIDLYDNIINKLFSWNDLYNIFHSRIKQSI